MEIIGPILFFILVIPLSICGVIALFAALILLLPGPIQEARTNLEAHPWRSIFLGFLNILGAGIIFLLLVALATSLMWANQGFEAVIGQIIPGLMVLILIAIAIPVFIGLSAAIMLTGTRLGERPKPFYTYLRGGGLLLLACAVPFIGWFVFTPLLMSASLGSVLGLLKRPKKAPVPETTTEEKRQIKSEA